MQTKLKSKRTQAIIATAIAALLVLSGAFAWYTFSQNRINTFELLPSAPGVNLHDDFAGGPEKDVYIENSGDFDVLVRVRLSELIKRGNELTPKNAVDDDDAFGWHIHTPADGCDICGFEAHNYFDWTMDGQKFYMPAHLSAKGSDSVEPLAIGDKGTVIDYAALLKNAFAEMYAGDQAGLNTVLALMDAYLGGDDSSAAYLMTEIAKIPDTYTVSVKQYASQPESEYTRKLNEVRLTLVPSQIITMADWRSGTTYGTPLAAGDFWVMDADGWCYWANRLAPNTATGQLLSEVNYKNNYSGEDFTYKINVHLNATSFEDTSLATFFLIAEQNGGISDEAMILMFLTSGEYIFGEDGEIYRVEGGGFYRKVNKNNGRYVNYTLGEKVYVSPGSLPGGSGGLGVGGQFDLDGDGNMTDGGGYQIEDIQIGDDGVPYYDVGGGNYLVPVDENGNPDNSGDKYAIVHPGTDISLGTDDDIGPVRADGSYPQWYFIDITEVTDGDVIATGQKGTLIRANDASEVPVQSFSVQQTVYRVQSITRGENDLLYLKLDEDLYAVALNAYANPVNLTMSEIWENGETVPVPSTYYIIYPGESGKIGTESDTTDATPVISAQPVSISGVYGDTAKMLSVTATGAGTHTYQWYKDGAPIAGATSNTLDVTDVADSGSYYCKITADIGHSSAVIDTDTVTVSITKRPITITAGSASKDYDGTPLTHDNYAITSGSIADGDDLSVTVTGSRTEVGTADNEISTYTITRSGTDVTANYNVTTGDGTLTVNPKSASSMTIEVTSSHIYNGLEQTPTYTVKDGGTTLTLGTHYNNVSVTNNINAGTATISVDGMGNYSGKATQTFTIAKAALTVTANSQYATYRDAVPSYGVTYNGFVNGENSSVLGGTLTYDCTYTATSNVGPYDIMPKGLTSPNYAISFVNGTLTVNPKSLSGAVINVTGTYTYDGTAQIPTFTVTDGGVSLISGTHFTAAYTNNTNAHATAPTITITGTGNYKDTVSKNFTIDRRPITITSGSASKDYDGTSLTNSGYSVTSGSLASGDSLLVLLSGTITDVGTANNTISAHIITNASSADVTANYNVTLVPGTLTITQPYAGGKGTQAEPYLIATKTHLDYLNTQTGSKANYTVGKYFKQTADIDLGGVNWTPIGKNSINYYFYGSYDGGGYKITGMNVIMSSSNAGLFGRVSGGTVKNLAVEGNVTITSSGSLGGIAGYITDAANIENCTFRGTVKVVGGSSNIGGIVGNVSATESMPSVVSHCGVLFGSEVIGGMNTGGIVGYATYADIRNNYSLARINRSTNYYAGGVVGDSVGGSISQSAFLRMPGFNDIFSATSTSSGATKSQIGYFKEVGGNLTTTNSSGTMPANLLTLLNDGTTTWVRNGSSWPYPAVIRDKGWNGNAESFTDMDGTYTYIKTPGQLLGLCNSINTSATNSTANIFSKYKLSANIDLNGIPWTPVGTSSYTFRTELDGNGYAIKGLNVQGGGYAGLFGVVDGATIKNLKVEGYVSGTGSTGGLIGTVEAYVYGESNAATISNCSFTGIVYGTGFATGGIVGDWGANDRNGDIENCYVGYGSRIMGSGTGNFGGICGYAFSYEAFNISNCYSLAEMTATSGTKGGVIGSHYNDGSFYFTRSVFLRTASFNNGLDAIGNIPAMGNPSRTQIGYFAAGGTELTLTNSSTGTMPANLLSLLQEAGGAGKWRAAKDISENDGYTVLTVQK